jgi:hypothetical protein
VGKERVSLEGFHDRNYAIVASNAQVIALSNVVG